MTFRLPKIKSCCCFSLETGTKIIGCLQMLFFVAVIAILPIFQASRAPGIFQEIIWESTFFNMGIFAVIMLNGAHKRDHTLIFPWILLQSVYMLVRSVSLLGNLAYLGLMDRRVGLMEMDFFMIVYFALTILVVYNYYRELQERGSEQM